MVVEFGVVIRRQLPRGETKWQLWTGAGKAKEDASFLVVMNFAGAQGYEAVAAGHFDELGVPEVLLQRRMSMPEPAKAAVQAPLLPPVMAAAAPEDEAKPPQVELDAKSRTPKAPAKKKRAAKA
jgi:hypothetical protein